MTTAQAKFPPKLLPHFLAIVIDEIGEKNLPVVLSKSQLPIAWADKKTLKEMNPQTSAEIYAGLQQAIRTYYGRGSRGILQRIGSKFWTDLLKNASFREKAQAKLLKGLSETRRRKSALDLLIRLLDVDAGDMSAHTLDLNLVLVDNISPTTYNQVENDSICYMTQGLIREAIYWATSQDPLIEEVECKAKGDKNCEFKITFE